MCLIFPPGLSLCLSLNVAFCVPFLDNALHIQKRHPVGIWKHSYQLHGPPYLLPLFVYVLLLFHVETMSFLIYLNIYIYTRIVTLSDVTQKEIVICMISMKNQYLQAVRTKVCCCFYFIFEPSIYLSSSHVLCFLSSCTRNKLIVFFVVPDLHFPCLHELFCTLGCLYFSCVVFFLFFSHFSHFIFLCFVLVFFNATGKLVLCCGVLFTCFLPVSLFLFVQAMCCSRWLRSTDRSKCS